MMMIFWYTLKWKSDQMSLNVSVETNLSRAEAPKNPFKGQRGSCCFQEQSPGAVHPSEGSWWCWHDAALCIAASSSLWCQARLTSAQQAVTMHDGRRLLQALRPLLQTPLPPTALMQPKPCITTILNSHSAFQVAMSSNNGFWLLCPTLAEGARSTIFITAKSALACCMKVFVPAHKLSSSLWNHRTSMLFIARKADGAVIFSKQIVATCTFWGAY